MPTGSIAHQPVDDLEDDLAGEFVTKVSRRISIKFKTNNNVLVFGAHKKKQKNC